MLPLPGSIVTSYVVALVSLPSSFSAMSSAENTFMSLATWSCPATTPTLRIAPTVTAKIVRMTASFEK